MHALNLLISLSLLLSVTSCLSDNESQSLAPVKNNLQSTALLTPEPTPAPTAPQIASVNTKAIPDRSAVMLSEPTSPLTPLKRPSFKDFMEGGKMVKKIKTSFIKSNSWLVVFETKDEFPQLQVILLSPDDEGRYQKIAIDTFNYDGVSPETKELFFVNTDNDSAKELVILCTWDVKHQGLGINATDYKVSIYDNQIDPDTNKVKQMNELMEKFGSGMEGVMEEEKEHYQWKDKASIVKAIEGFIQR